MNPPTRQQQIEAQVRVSFMILQHRIEERNWAEAVQNSAILSKILMEMQKVSIESIHPSVKEEQHDTTSEDQSG